MTLKRKFSIALATLALALAAQPFASTARACEWADGYRHSYHVREAPRVHRYRSYGYAPRVHRTTTYYGDGFGYWSGGYAYSYGYAPAYYYVPRRTVYAYAPRRYRTYGYAPRTVIRAGFYAGPRYRARTHSYRRDGISYVAFPERRRAHIHYRYKARHRAHR